MFRAQVLIFWRPKLYYTVSGIITLKQVQFWPPEDEHVFETCRGMK